MGTGKKFKGSPASLIQTIREEEETPDASLAPAFIWSEEEHMDDLRLKELEEEKLKLHQVAEPAAPVAAEKTAEGDIVVEKEQQKTLDTTEEAKGSAAGVGMWDVVFFMLLGVVAVVAGWWA